MLLPDAPLLPDFPARRDDIPIRAATVTFQRASLDHLTFLRELYRSLRVHEFASLGWPPEQMCLFLDQQFDMQHRYYMATYPQADFLLVIAQDAPVGRLYLDASRDPWCIVDIAVKPERRNGGIGSAIMGSVQRGAQATAGAGVMLHVACDNHGAQRLYHRLGFREVARQEQTYARMEWHPGADGVSAPLTVRSIS